jgi:hypothetical protein
MTAGVRRLQVAASAVADRRYKGATKKAAHCCAAFEVVAKLSAYGFSFASAGAFTRLGT